MTQPTINQQLAAANARIAELERDQEETLWELRESTQAEAELEIRQLRAQLAATDRIQQERDEALRMLESLRTRGSSEESRTTRAHSRDVGDTFPADHRTRLESTDDPYNTPVARGGRAFSEGLRPETAVRDIRPTRRPFVKEPGVFAGERTDYRRFLGQVRLSLRARREEFRTEEERILFVASLFTDKVTEWFTREFWAEVPPIWADDLDLFFAAFEDQWGPRGTESEARIALRYVEQGDMTVAEFYEHFRKLCYEANLDPEDHADDFRRRLSDQLQDDMITRGPVDPKSLHGWFTLAKRFEDRRSERRAELGARRRGPAPGSGTTQNNRPTQPRGGKGQTTEGPTAGAPRQPGHQQNRPTGNSNNPATRDSKGTNGGGPRRCFQCNRPGHIKRDCPDAARPSASINAIEEDQGEEDWEEAKN